MKLHIFLSFVFLALATSLEAGFSNATQVAGVEKYGQEAIDDLTREVIRAMDEREVNVAIIARGGRAQEELPDGIQFTHTGIAVFEPVQKPDGEVVHTYTVYNLYQGAGGDNGKSYLAQDFVYNMVVGTATGEIGIIVPVPALQKKIVEVIRSETYGDLQIADYNLLANPHRELFDNCVSHTLKVTVASIYDTADSDRIYRNINDYYTPQEVRLSGLQRVGLRFVDGISSADQDGSTYQTATFLSVKRFLAEHGLLERYLVVSFDGVTSEEIPGAEVVWNDPTAR